MKNRISINLKDLGLLIRSINESSLSFKRPKRPLGFRLREGSEGNLNEKPQEMVGKLIKINRALKDSSFPYKLIVAESYGDIGDHVIYYALIHDNLEDMEDLNTNSVRYNHLVIDAEEIIENSEHSLGIPIPYGSISFAPPHRKVHGPCDGAYVVELVTETPPSSGWGPLLYDLAIERATEINGGKGLTSDRSEVSLSAERVWANFQFRRSDVHPQPLDNLDNFLTPAQEDNCKMPPTDDDHGNPDDPDGDHSEASWIDSPLSKRYSKSPQILSRLRSLGLYMRI